MNNTPSLSDEERRHAQTCFMMFQAMEAQERTDHFEEVASGFCSEEWREKFREYAQNYPQSSEESNTQLAKEISDHACIEYLMGYKSEDISGCKKCRDAFWNLVVLTAADY